MCIKCTVMMQKQTFYAATTLIFCLQGERMLLAHSLPCLKSYVLLHGYSGTYPIGSFLPPVDGVFYVKNSFPHQHAWLSRKGAMPLRRWVKYIAGLKHKHAKRVLPKIQPLTSWLPLQDAWAIFGIGFCSKACDFLKRKTWPLQQKPTPL